METEIKNGIDLINQMKKSYSNSGNREYVRDVFTKTIANPDQLTKSIDSINSMIEIRQMLPIDEFAKTALQSYMINCKAIQVNDGYIAETELDNLSKYSYQIADAMMKEKAKRHINLCSHCKNDFATCNSNPEFGLAVGNDNVISCDKFQLTK